jgi:hypothetical protein
MKVKLVLKVIALIGVPALIAAGYCFWLMTVPLSYDWVPVVLIGFVVAIGVFLISVINFICRPYAIAAISSCIECSGDHADHLTPMNGVNEWVWISSVYMD